MLNLNKYVDGLNKALFDQKNRISSLIDYMGNKIESSREISQRQNVLIALCDIYQELLDDARFKEVMQQAEVVEKKRQNRKL